MYVGYYTQLLGIIPSRLGIIPIQVANLEHTFKQNIDMFLHTNLYSFAQAIAKIKVPQAKQSLVDARFSRLSGQGRIGRQDKSVFRKRSTMITSDWQHFLEYCDVYAFHGVLDEPYGSSYFQLTGVLRSILQYKSTTLQSDTDAQEELRRRECEIAASLTAFERHWPSVLMSGPVIHTLVHYPRFVYRWNSVRNYWCYFNERYTLIMQVCQVLYPVVAYNTQWLSIIPTIGILAGSRISSLTETTPPKT